MIDKLRTEISDLTNSTIDALIAEDILRSVEKSKESIRVITNGDQNYIYLHMPQFNEVINF
jgi:hypothetical protein